MKRLKAKTARKLASLSALGAGALVWSPQAAEAGTIQYSGIINQTIGIGQSWQTGDGGSLSLGTGARLGFSLYVCGCSNAIARVLPNASLFLNIVALNSVSNSIYPFLKLVNAGVMQSGLYYTNFGPAIASFKSSIAGLYSGGQRQFQNRFALFSFRPSATVSSYDYGWVHLNLSAGANPLTAQLTIVDYAFDKSGARIPAGYVPEPGTFGSSALAALVLGAAGLRKWRAARRQAA